MSTRLAPFREDDTLPSAFQSSACRPQVAPRLQPSAAQSYTCSLLTRMEPDIVIVCPKCASKAAFYSPSIVRHTVLVPSLAGTVVCPSCGFNKAHTFSSSDYFHKIEVGDRFLFARTLSTANALKDHFENDSRRSTDPELDFPKVFYERKDEIVRKLDQLIKDNT